MLGQTLQLIIAHSSMIACGRMHIYCAQRGGQYVLVAIVSGFGVWYIINGHVLKACGRDIIPVLHM